MKQKLTKLECAERQLAEAIVLYFERRHPVAIHTLAAAAHQIIFDLCRKKGIEGSLLKSCLYIRPEKKKMWLQKISEAENFFKHADRDPDAAIEFNPATTTYFIVDALELHCKLTGGYLAEGRIFLSHFIQLNPDFIQPHAASQILPALAKAEIDPNDYKLHLENLDLLREHKTIDAVIEHLKKGGAIPKR